MLHLTATFSHYCSVTNQALTVRILVLTILCEIVLSFFLNILREFMANKKTYKRMETMFSIY